MVLTFLLYILFFVQLEVYFNFVITYFAALESHDITPENIHYVISTHGHSDHIGNNNLFLMAKHIVGFSVSFKDEYYTHPFDKGRKSLDSN